MPPDVVSRYHPEDGELMWQTRVRFDTEADDEKVQQNEMEEERLLRAYLVNGTGNIPYDDRPQVFSKEIFLLNEYEAYLILGWIRIQRQAENPPRVFKRPPAPKPKAVKSTIDVEPSAVADYL